MSEYSSFQDRIDRLQNETAAHDLDGIVIGPGANLYYYTGTNALILDRPHLLFVPKEGDLHLVVPRLEAASYERSPLNVISHIWDDGEGPSKAFDDLARQVKISSRWGSDGAVPFRFFRHLAEYVEGGLMDAEPILQEIRAVKDEHEMELTEKGLSILCDSYKKIPQMLREGMTELELARKLSDDISYQGAEVPHEPMVQSGPKAADPHAFPSSKKIARGESIVIDIVCKYDGYHADMARSFIIGDDKEFEDIYSKVLEAQERAIKVANNGSRAGDIDRAAREYLSQNGLGSYFIHRTGHGLGLETIEAPNLIPGGTTVLKPSMVFNIEPGVYVPDRLGVRIEDELVTRTGETEVISSDLPKEFGWWK
jgi:Xaa-Pro dipeptidase